MSAGNRAASTTSTPPTLAAVPARARALAARLAALFETDQEIVARLNGAHHLLAGSNDRLRSDPAADPLRVHQQIHRAFWAYQQACEQRRQLAVDVGELSARLTDALTAAGYRPQQARSANVHELAAGAWHTAEAGKENER
jgi:hypothetical protein